MSNTKKITTFIFYKTCSGTNRSNAFMAFSAWPTMVDVAKGNMMPGADMGLIAEIFNTSGD